MVDGQSTTTPFTLKNAGWHTKTIVSWRGLHLTFTATHSGTPSAYHVTRMIAIVESTPCMASFVLLADDVHT